MAYANTNPTHYKTQNKRSDTSKLAILCLISFIALGSFAAIKMVPEGDFSLAQFFSTKKSNNKHAVELGGVELGSTIDLVRNTQPEATKSLTATGAITMAFAEKDSAYMVWYGEDGPNHVAYKARQTRIIRDMSEDEFVGQLTVKYGAPTLSSCSRRVTDGIRDCHFSWWIPKDIRLDLSSRQFSKSPTPTLKVMMQITDTRMDLRLQRTAQRTAGRKASSVSIF